MLSGGGGHVYRDWKAGGHGLVDLHKAIVQSCDTYFYGLAQDLGIDAIHQFIGQFGFGKLTGIDIDGEVDGLLPSQEWKQKRFQQKWFVGDTISIGVGQGYMLATPLQLAFATAILANDGRVFRPHVVKQIQDSQTDALTIIEPQPRAEIPLSKENVKRVRDAMIDVTRPGGTAAWAGLNAKYLFAGKTGTAQVIGMKGQKYDEKQSQRTPSRSRAVHCLRAGGRSQDRAGDPGGKRRSRRQHGGADRASGAGLLSAGQGAAAAQAERQGVQEQEQEND